MVRYLLSLLLLVHHVMADAPTSVDDACTLPLDTFYILDSGQVIYHAHTWLSTIKFTWTDGSTVADYTGNTEFPVWSISGNSISYGLGARRRLEDRQELIREQRKAHPMQAGLVEGYMGTRRRRLLHDTNTSASENQTHAHTHTEYEQDGAPITITTYCGEMVNLTFTGGTVSRSVVASDVDHEGLVLVPFTMGCTNDYYEEYDASAHVDTDPSSCATRLNTGYLAADPSDLSFAWSLGACGAQQFRRLVGSSETCEACDRKAFATAYKSVVLDNNTAATYRHGRCCSNTHHDVCIKMRAEYDAQCPETCS